MRCILNDWLDLLYNDFYTLPQQIQASVYDTFYNLVYKDIYFLVNDHNLTEDIIQDSFLKIITIIKKYEISNLSAWLRKTTRNLAIDYHKKNKNDRNIVDINSVIYYEIESILASQQISVTEEVENKVRDELLHQAVLKLKTDYQEIIKLFYLEGHSYKDIAVKLGISEPAVSQKLARARKKLLSQFLRKWDDIVE